MSSLIWQALSLIVYNIPVPAVESVQWMEEKIEEYRRNGLALDGNITVREARPGSRQNIVRIITATEACENNPAIMHQLNTLKQHLIDENIECTWAACRENDRSASACYAIKARMSQPRLKDNVFRKDILNGAAAVAGITPSNNVWQDGTITLNLHVNGYVQFASPDHAATVIAIREFTVTSPLDQSVYDITFSMMEHHIEPTYCTTLALYLSDPYDYNFQKYSEKLQTIVEHVGRVRNTAASVTNIVESECRSYLLCDPVDIPTAYAICEYPMPNECFFRPVFIMNLQHNNYLPPNQKQWNSEKMDDYRKKSEHYDPGEGALPPLPATYQVFKALGTKRKRDQVTTTSYQTTARIQEGTQVQILMTEKKLKKFKGVPENTPHQERDRLREQLKNLKIKMAMNTEAVQSTPQPTNASTNKIPITPTTTSLQQMAITNYREHQGIQDMDELMEQHHERPHGYEGSSPIKRPRGESPQDDQD